MTPAPTTDPRFDLVFEREVALSPAQIWLAWTTPDLIIEWFTPAPWKTLECQIDLRPGGMFRTVMQSPGGETFPHVGCYLDIVAHEQLVWTNALGPGYRPLASPPTPCISAIIHLEEVANGTRYTAVARHKDEADRSAHEAMGFAEGWGKALDQLVETMQRE